MSIDRTMAIAQRIVIQIVRDRRSIGLIVVAPVLVMSLVGFSFVDQRPVLDRIAPALIAVFAQRHGEEEGERHYYVNESVGISVGFLLAGLHQAGLVSLTHTPSPMKFLHSILGRPDNERPFLLIPVGYPAEDCQVPDLERKHLDEVMAQV